MKKRTKFVSFVLALCMILNIISVPAYAASETEVAGASSYSEASEISIGTEYVTPVTSKGVYQWYKFTTPADKGYCYLQTKNISVPAHSVWSYANLYASVSNTYGETYITNKHVSAKYGSDWIYGECELEPSTTYYVRIQANEGGTYPGYMKFKLTYKADEYANELTNASSVELNKEYSSTIDGYGDEDWFKFTTSDSTKYELYGMDIDIETHTVYSYSEYFFRVSLMNKYGESLSEVRTRYDEDGTNTVILEPNTTYYIQVKNYFNSSVYQRLTETGKYKFSIGKPEIKTENVTIEDTSYTYDGKEKKPSVTVVYNGETLVNDKDYKVTYSNNINAGNAKVTVQGIGDYIGTVDNTYTIEKQKINSDNISISKTKYVYNGKAKSPLVTVKNANGTELIKDTDYTVEYASGRTSVGRYSVKVSMKGNYSGRKTMYFTIVPKKVSSASATLRVRNGGYDDVKFSWKKSAGATGYNVYYKKASASKWKYKDSTAKTYMYINNLDDGVKYTFKVVPFYQTSSGNTKYFDKTQYRTDSVTTLKAVNKISVSKSGTKVKVKWNNIAGESGYEISKSTSKTGLGNVKTVPSTSATSTLVSATKGKTYYYKVRAYKSVDGSKVYAPWSTAIKFKR